MAELKPKKPKAKDDAFPWWTPVGVLQSGVDAIKAFNNDAKALERIKRHPVPDALLDPRLRERIQETKLAMPLVAWGGIQKGLGGTEQLLAEVLTNPNAVSEMVPNNPMKIIRSNLEFFGYKRASDFLRDAKAPTPFMGALKARGERVHAAGEDTQKRAMSIMKDPKEWQKVLSDLGDSLGVSLPTMLAAIALKKPNIALGSMSMMTGGRSFAECTRAGKDGATCTRYAAIDGFVEYWTEKMPLKFAMKSGTNFWKRMAQMYVSDIGGENVATTLQSANEFITLHPEKTFVDWITWLGKEGIPRTTAVSLLASTIQGPIAHTMSLGMDKIQQRKASRDQAAKKKALGPTNEAIEAVDLGMAMAEEVQAQAGQVETEAKAQPIKEIKGVTPEMLLQQGSGDTKIAGTNLAKALDNMKTTEDIENLYLNVVQLQEKEFRAARRDMVSVKQTTKEAAKILGTDPQTLMQWKKGQAFNPAQLRAMAVLVKGATKKLHAASVKAIGGSDADQLDFHRWLNQTIAMKKIFVGAKAEAGRALNILKQPDMQVGGLEEILDKVGGRDTTTQKAKIIAKLARPEDMMKAVDKMERATPFDLAFELWVNWGLLSGYQTHVVNITSNTLFDFLTVPQHAVAAGIGSLRTAPQKLYGMLRGKKYRTKKAVIDKLTRANDEEYAGDRVYWQEIVPQYIGMVEGARHGLSMMWETFRTEESSDMYGKMEANIQRAWHSDRLGIREDSMAGRTVNVFGQVARLPGRALITMDEFFRGIGFYQGLYTLATRKGIDKGYRGRELKVYVDNQVVDPDEALRKRAWKQARYQTFTTPSGYIGRAFTKVVHHLKPLRFVIPFIRTVGNIVKTAVEWSPAAPLVLQDVRTELKKGGAAFDVQASRVAVGTAVASLVWWLTSLGFFTGNPPRDPREREAWYRLGLKPVGVRIGGKVRQISRIEPLGMLIGVTVDAYKLWGQMDEMTKGEIAGQIAFSLSKNLTSKAFMQGLSDMIKMVEDPERYGDRWWIRFGGTAVPTLLAQHARVSDPYLKRVETLIDAWKARIPGLRKEVPDALNLWGERIPLGGSLGPDLFSPIYESTESKDRVNNEMYDLEIYPAMPNRIVHGVRLPLNLYYEYVRMAGAPAKKQLDLLMAQPSWNTTPVGHKRLIIENIIKVYRLAGREQFLSKYPHLRQQTTEQRKQKRLGEKIKTQEANPQ